MVRTKNREKKPITYRVSNYIKSILTEEYITVKAIYIRNHDPFYGWVVGNLLENNIKEFVCKNFNRDQQEGLSESKSKNNQMEFSLLFNSINELQSKNKIENFTFNDEKLKEFSKHLLPASPEDFSLYDWFIIRQYYNHKKREQNKEFMNDLAEIGSVNEDQDNPPVGQETKYGGIRKRIGSREGFERRSDEIPGREKPDYGKQRGTTSLEDHHILRGDEYEGLFVNERIGQKEIFTAERYLSIVRNEILDEMEPNMEPDIFKVVLKDKDSLTLQLIFSKRGDLDSTFTLMEEKLQPELDEYLGSKYNDVSSQLMSRNIDGIDFVIYLASFSLDAVRKSKHEDLFFIRNDDVFLNLEP